MAGDPNEHIASSRRHLSLEGQPGLSPRVITYGSVRRRKAYPAGQAGVIALAVVLGAVGGALVWVESHSLLASVVILGVFWLMGVAVLTSADMAHRNGRKK